MWKIEYTETARKNLLAMGKQEAKRIKEYLDKRIATNNNPCRFGESLKGDLAGLWKYRVGKFRVIVEIQEDIKTVLVVCIGHRKNVYGGH